MTLRVPRSKPVPTNICFAQVTVDSAARMKQAEQARTPAMRVHRAVYDSDVTIMGTLYRVNDQRERLASKRMPRVRARTRALSM